MGGRLILGGQTLTLGGQGWKSYYPNFAPAFAEAATEAALIGAKIDLLGGAKKKLHDRRTL